MEPRGLRLNNPGNIRHGDQWRGLAAEQDDDSFCHFISPVWGIRAIAKILINYGDSGIRTVGKIISRWAPPSENNTVSYIKHVCKVSGFEADQPLNMHDYDTLHRIIKGIILHENGKQPYSDDVIDDAISLALPHSRTA